MAQGELHVKDSNASEQILKTTLEGTSMVTHHIIDQMDAGSGAANIGKKEDEAHSSGDVGVFLLGVRRAAASTQVSAAGDYTGLIVDDSGRLYVTEERGSDLFAKLDLIETAVSGSEMQVDVVAALPAGDNNIGNVDIVTLPALAAGSNFIGEVHVTDLLPGSAAGNLGKVEDAAFSSGDTGVMLLAVRRSAASTEVSAAGDYHPLLVTDSGRLYTTEERASDIFAKLDVIETAVSGSEMQVDVVAALPAGDNNIGNVDIVTLPALAAGSNFIGAVHVTDILSGSGAANLGKEDDAAHSASDIGVMSLAIRRSAASTQVTVAGDYTPLIVDDSGRLYTTEERSSDIFAKLDVIETAVAGSEVQVDVVTLPALTAGSNFIGDVHVTDITPGSATLNLGKQADTAAGASDVGVTVLAVRDTALSTLDGTVDGDYTQLRVDASGALHVTGGGGGTQYQEDNAHSSGDTGTAALVVRGDVASTISSLDGDYTLLQVSQSGRLYTTDERTSDIFNKLDVIETAVSGSEVQVDVVTLPALTAGSNFVGNVHITDITPGSATLNLGKQADTAAGASDVGVTVLAVRDTALSTLDGTVDGDYTQLRVDASGALHVTGGGGGTQYQEDNAHSTGDTGTAALVVRGDAASTLSTTDGDYTLLQVNQSGRLYTTEERASDIFAKLDVIETAVSGSEMQVDIVSPGTGETNLGKQRDTNAGGSDVGIAVLAIKDTAVSDVAGVPDGAYMQLRVNASGALHVTGGGGGTQYEEDNAHTTGDTGTAALVVRNDAPSTISSADGDYTLLQVNQSGRLYTTEERASDIFAKLDVIETAVSGSEVQVDVVTLPALAAGSNFIGEVHVTDVLPGSAADNLGKQEDAAHSSGDTGVMTLAVRRAAASTQVSVLGDYAPLIVDDSNRLYTTEERSSDIFNKLDVIETAVSGSEMQVDVVAALPAGDNNIGNVDVVTLPALAAGSNFIGEVHITDVLPGSAAGNLGKAEDAVHSSADIGVAVWAVRNDAPSTLVSLDGDYAPFQVNQSGRLYTEEQNTSAIFAKLDVIETAVSGSEMQVDVVAALPAGDNNIGNVDIVTLPALAAGSNFIGEVHITDVLPGSAAANLGKQEDAVHASGDIGVAVWAVRQAAASTLVSLAGDYSPLTVNDSGRLYVESQHGSNIFSKVDTLATVVSGSRVRILSGTGPTHLGKVEDGVHSSSDVGVMTLAVRQAAASTLVSNTGDYAPLQVNDSGRLYTTEERASDIFNKLDVIETAVSGSEVQVDIVTDLPASNTADNVGAALMTDAIMLGTTALEPKFALVNTTQTDASNEIVAAVSAKKIRVLAAFFSAEAPSTLMSIEGGSNSLTGSLTLAASGGFTLPFNPVGWFETPSGSALGTQNTTGASVDGAVVYVEV